jgi:hypothetical protein
MTHTWNPLRTCWNHVIRVVLIAVVSCVSACTTLGHSSSNPSTHSPEGGHAGLMLSGDVNGGSGM